jgi:RNA polymerase sigma factor (sigma-70 family)
MADVDDTALRPARGTVISGTDLRRRLRLGDERVLAEMYDAHAPLVHGLALRVTGDPAAAEAVTEEVFVTVWEHPERFDPRTASVDGWLAALAHRAAVERLRRHGVPAPPTDAAVPGGPDPTGAAAPLTGPVGSAIAALDADERAALLLAYFGGRTYREVGDVLGIPHEIARARIGTALHHVAARLTAEGMLS